MMDAKLDDIISFSLILPELTLAVITVALLVWGVLLKQQTTSLFYGGLTALLVTAALLSELPYERDVTLSGMFVSNGFILLVKFLVLAASFLVMLLSLGYYQHDKIRKKFEFPILMLLSILGMLLLLSSGDLLAMYMSIELMSLALYILAAMHSNSQRSSEAGLKYFVLGALASGLLLYGCSLIYGYTGTISFTALQAYFVQAETVSLGVIVGLVLILVALCFKVSAVPFHMWTPDVYEGAPTPVTAFFAVAPKVAVLGFFMRLLFEPFGHLVGAWQQIIIVVSVASMIVGAFAALRQTNIKRLLAYSSIGHIGYALVGVAIATDSGLRASLIYIALYITMTVGMFACILMMRHKVFSVENKGFTEQTSDLSGLARVYPLRALAIAIFMFSMTGIPPFAGFWGKLFIFESAIREGYYILSVIGVLTSVVAAFYYLNIVKIMYLDAPASLQFVRESKREITVVAFAAALFNGLFFLMPTLLFDPLSKAVDYLLL